MIEQKEKDDVSMLIKELTERNYKKKKGAGNIQFSSTSNRDVFHERVRLDAMFTGRRKKEWKIKKAWRKVQRLWNNK